MLRLPCCWHSLESPVGVLHDNCTGMAQDKARNPALSCGALVSGGSEHQKHVLLVTGQNLNDLSLIDVYLILLHCRVLVCHQHGGDVATAAAFTLEGKREKRRWAGTETRSYSSSCWWPWHQPSGGLADRQTGRRQTPPSHALQLNASPRPCNKLGRPWRNNSKRSTSVLMPWEPDAVGSSPCPARAAQSSCRRRVGCFRFKQVLTLKAAE